MHSTPSVRKPIAPFDILALMGHNVRQRGVKMAEYVERAIRPAPGSLVNGGKFEFGTFSSQFKQVDPLDFNRYFGMGEKKYIRG